MVKMILKWLIILLVAFHIGPVMVWLLGLAGYLNVGNTFVGYVNTPSYPNTLEQLSELNLRGSGEVVKLHGLRPIFIVEDNLNKIKRYYTDHKDRKIPYSILGVAWPLPGYCLIIMDNTIEKEDYQTVLWHEYLHCFYYGHNDTPGDIMAPMAGYLNENSVDVYLKEIKEQVYE